MEMKARIWAKRTEQTLEGGAGGPVEWRQQRQVRFGDSEYIDHVVYIPCLYTMKGQQKEGVRGYLGKMVQHLHFLSGEFRLYPTGLEDPGKGNEQKKGRATIVF